MPITQLKKRYKQAFISTEAENKRRAAIAMAELRLEDFPAWYFHSHDKPAQQVADFLEILLENAHERFEVSKFLIPSVVEMALYFQYPEIDIIDALQLLTQRKGYSVQYGELCFKITVWKERDRVPQRPAMDDEALTEESIFDHYPEQVPIPGTFASAFQKLRDTLGDWFTYAT